MIIGNATMTLPATGITCDHELNVVRFHLRASAEQFFHCSAELDVRLLTGGGAGKKETVLRKRRATLLSPDAGTYWAIWHTCGAVTSGANGLVATRMWHDHAEQSNPEPAFERR